MSPLAPSSSRSASATPVGDGAASASAVPMDPYLSPTNTHESDDDNYATSVAAAALSNEQHHQQQQRRRSDYGLPFGSGLPFGGNISFGHFGGAAADSSSAGNVAGVAHSPASSSSSSAMPVTSLHKHYYVRYKDPTVLEKLMEEILGEGGVPMTSVGYDGGGRPRSGISGTVTGATGFPCFSGSDLVRWMNRRNAAKMEAEDINSVCLSLLERGYIVGVNSTAAAATRTRSKERHASSKVFHLRQTYRAATTEELAMLREQEAFRDDDKDALVS